MVIIADADLPPPSYSKERRRSSCTPRRDPDEILRNLKAVKGELLGRSMSISVDKRGNRSKFIKQCYVSVNGLKINLSSQ